MHPPTNLEVSKPTRQPAETNPTRSYGLGWFGFAGWFGFKILNPHTCGFGVFQPNPTQPAAMGWVGSGLRVGLGSKFSTRTLAGWVAGL